LPVGVANHVSRDCQLLDLRRAFVDTEEANITVKSFYRVLGNIARTAVNLHRAVRDTIAHLGGEELAARSFRRHIFVVVAASSTIERAA
jgi:hypothetical protein